MLGRLKFDITDLVNEILDQLPPEIWTSKTTTFLDPAMGGGQFVAEVEQRLRVAGHSNKNIAKRVFGFESNQMRINYAVNKYNLVGNYQAEDFLEAELSKKFDVIVGNPPYQDKTGNENSTNSKDLYAKFVDKSLKFATHYIALVVPSAWTGPKKSNIKISIFEENQPFVINTHQTKWFKVQMNTCYFITAPGRKGITEVTDNYGNSLSLSLNRSVSIPTNLSSLGLRDKILKNRSTLDNRWIRGKLHLNQIDQVHSSHYVEIISAVGSKHEPNPKVFRIDPEVESTGARLHKVVIPNLGSSDSLGNIKIGKKDQVGGHSVIFLVTASDSESRNLKLYLESRLVKWLVKSTKISTPNSKTVFSFIPEIDLTRSCTDQDLYDYFGLTLEEIEYIES